MSLTRNPSYAVIRQLDLFAAKPEPARTGGGDGGGDGGDGGDGLTTLAEARALVAANVETGIACPCCEQFVRLYKRKLNSNMARFLCSLVRISRARDDAWVSFKDCIFEGRDYPYIALWGLAETRANDDDAKKNSGLWKPTKAGIDFAMARLRVPSHVHVLNNRIVGWSEATVDVRDALGSSFDYAEMMK